jgi:hypothetical protein
MTSSAMASAFVKSHVARHVLREAVVSQPFGAGFGIATGQISTALNCVNPQIAETCFAFFESIKVPSTLIAGASLTSLFTFTREVQETYNFSKLQVMLLRVYHMFSLLTFCLSITTVLTSQTATTSLLLNSNRLLAGESLDAFAFLRANMNFEMLVARCSFIYSIFSFFLATTFRMFVEFGLFSPTRRTAGTMVSSMMAAVVCFLLSFANTSQVGLPGLWSSTKEVAMVRANNSFTACDTIRPSSPTPFCVLLDHLYPADCLASCLCC